jgi:DNA polymerase-1
MDLFTEFGINPQKHPTLILIDTLNFIYRGWFAYEKLNQEGKRPVAHLFGAIKMLSSIKRNNPRSELAFALDGRPVKRIAINPEYKANRKSSIKAADFGFNPIKEAIQLLMDTIPSRWYYNKEAEADDVIATLVRSLREDGQRTLIISSDKDLWALLTEDISSIGNKQAKTTPRVVQEKLGVHPLKVPLWKAFFGDTSDGIKGVPRLRKKIMIPLIAAYSSVSEIYEHLDEGLFSANELKKLADHKNQILMNEQIIGLDQNVACEFVVCEGNEEKLIETLTLRDCPSLIEEIEVFF